MLYLQNKKKKTYKLQLDCTFGFEWVTVLGVLNFNSTIQWSPHNLTSFLMDITYNINHRLIILFSFFNFYF